MSQISKLVRIYMLGVALWAIPGFAQLPGTPGAPNASTLPGTGGNSFQQAGVFPHIAAGDVWDTSITVLNLSPRPAAFKVTFRSDSGNLFPLPVATTSQAEVITTSTVEGTLAAYGRSQIVTRSVPGDALQVGSAILESTDSIGGFAILHYSGRESAGTEPLSASSTLGLVLPYDNSQGFVTGAALTNLSPDSAANITAIMRDNDGNSIDTQTISLPPLGHIGVVLPDQFPVLAGRAGSIEFRPGPGNISGVGFRFNPLGSFTLFPITVR